MFYFNDLFSPCTTNYFPIVLLHMSIQWALNKDMLNSYQFILLHCMFKLKCLVNVSALSFSLR